MFIRAISIQSEVRCAENTSLSPLCNVYESLQVILKLLKIVSYRSTSCTRCHALSVSDLYSYSFVVGDVTLAFQGTPITSCVHCVNAVLHDT